MKTTIVLFILFCSCNPLGRPPIVKPVGGSETSAEIIMIQTLDELPKETTKPEQ